MGWREIETARSRIFTEKRHAREWRDDELRKEEASTKALRKELEAQHKLDVMQIKNSYIEQLMRLDAEFDEIKRAK